MPLRFPRLAMAPAAIGLAAACVMLGSTPTLADQVRHQEWWLHALQVTQAWRTTEGSGVTVAVLDTGIDPAQPDLAGSVLTGPDFTHSGERPASPYFYNHGTAVASLIAGHGHGSASGGGPSGVVGVAPAAKILSVRVTLAASDPLLSNAHIAAGLPDAIAAGISYAARQGAQVIDLPLDPGQASADGTPGVSAAAGGGAAERSAIAYALRLGAVVVAPAGDDGAATNAGAGGNAGSGGNAGTGGYASTATNAVNYPAAYPGVISVGSFNRAIIKSPFSVRQHYVTLTAPGQGVIAAGTPRGYAVINSTSAASALVAGVAALIKSQFPELTPDQVVLALKDGTVFRPGGKTGDGSGAGTADAARALAAAATIAGPSAQRAGSGAQPHVLPVTPPLPTFPQSLTSERLEKDGIISAAVLVLLLLPIVVLAVLRRRRGGTSAFGEPEWRERERYSETKADNEDPKLAYHPAPAARAVSRASGSPRPGSASLSSASLSSASLSSASLGTPGRGTAGRSAASLSAASLAAGGGSDTGDADFVWGGAAGRAAAPPRVPAGRDTAGRETASRETAGRAAIDHEAAGREAADREPVWSGNAAREPGERDSVWGESVGHAGGLANSGDFAGFESLARTPRPASSAAFAGAASRGGQSGFAEPGENGGFGEHRFPERGSTEHSSFPASGENGGPAGFDSFAKPGLAGSDASARPSAGDAGSRGAAGEAGTRDAAGDAGTRGAAGDAGSRDAAGDAGTRDAVGDAGTRSPAGAETGTSGGPSLFEVGQGGFSGSSSFTGLSPRSNASGRQSAAGQVPGPVPGPVLAPITRPASSRGAKVSGSPPWEPAIKPDSELPWATVPAPQAITGRGTANLPRSTPSSAWDMAAGGTDSSEGDHPDDAEEHTGRDAGAAGASEGTDADADAPIYPWNPGATTEIFPSIPRDEN